MVGASRKTKKKIGGRARSRSADEPIYALSEAQPTRLQRTKEFASSALRKGAHDTVATFVKGGLIALAGAIVPWVCIHSLGYEIDLSALQSGKQIITNSNKEAPKIPDLETVNQLVNCRVNRLREIERLVYRRKYAWSLYERCKTDWPPTPNEKQTADEACATHLARYRSMSQDVKSREAKDECTTTQP